jgi:hypothetical protein
VFIETVYFLTFGGLILSIQQKKISAAFRVPLSTCEDERPRLKEAAIFTFRQGRSVYEMALG